MMHTVVLITTDKVDKKDGKPCSGYGGEMVVDTRGGVLTAHHVIADSSKIYMRCVNEHGFTRASLLVTDERRDLALIRRQAKKSVAGTTLDASVFNYFIKLSPAKSLEVGMDVYAISHPSRHIYTFARGRLAFPAKVAEDTNKGTTCMEVTPIRRRAMDCRGEKDIDLDSFPPDLHVLQLSNIHGGPGSSSGCPVFNCAGLVIGMEAFINNNFDFCIHSNVLKGFIKNGLKCLDQTSGKHSKVLGESSYQGSIKRKSPMHREGEGQGMRGSYLMLDVKKKQKECNNDGRKSLATKHDKLKGSILHDIKNLQISDFGKRPGEPDCPGETDCPFYLKTGSCKFGATCRFNHPERAIIPPVLAPLGHSERGINPANFPIGVYGTANILPNAAQALLGVTSNTYPQRPEETECAYYMKSGYCSFGERCKFHHPIDRTTPTVTAKHGLVPNVKLTLAGLPRREGSVACPFYMKTGICKYGATCKYDHPPPSEAVAVALANVLRSRNHCNGR